MAYKNSSNDMIDGTGLPYSLEAEQSVLGAILIDPDCVTKVMEILKPEYFYLPQHRSIFSNIQMMFSIGKPIDIITLIHELEKEGIYDEAAGKAYLANLAQMVPAVSNVDAYANIVREKYELRSLIITSRKIIDDAISNTTDSETLLDSAEQKIFNIRQGRNATDLRHIRDVISVDVYDRLEKMSSEDRDQYIGIPTGISGLDAIITGLNKSDLILIAARPGMGKTSFGLNIAQYVGKTTDRSICFFSLEMTCEQLASRMLSSEAKVSSTSLRTGKLTPEEWARLGQAADVLSRSNIYFDDTSSITVPEMKAKLRRMPKVDLVIIDYLQLMQAGGRVENRVQEISTITRGLKIMAKELNVPVICLSQLSRGPEKRTDHKPQLSDLRDSGSIEQDADIVLMLYREMYYNDETGENVASNTAECIVAKNRHGSTESVPLNWQGEFTTFSTQELRYDEQGG